MSIDDHLSKLADLYDITGDDWELLVQHSLTEPTQPTVIMRPEGSNSLRYRYDRTTIEDAIEAAAHAVYEEVILGNPVEPESPVTNSDDHPGDPLWRDRQEVDVVERLYAAKSRDHRDLHYEVAGMIQEMRKEIEDLKLQLSKKPKK